MQLKSQTRICNVGGLGELWLFQDIHYYIQRAAQMGREISENCFHKHFVLMSVVVLKDRGLPEKAELLLENNTSHISRWSPTSDNGLILQHLSFFILHNHMMVSKKC